MKKMVFPVIIFAAIWIGVNACFASNKPPSSVSNRLTIINENKVVLKAVYTADNDIQPSQFKVKKGVPAVLEIDVKDDGAGCMGSVMIQGLTQFHQPLVKGKKILLNFVAKAPGDYNITCGMGVPRGVIQVVN